MGNRTKLRHSSRLQRRHLSSAEQEMNANNVAMNIIDHPLLTHKKRFAFYVANDGELDPMPLLEACYHQGKQCYLPVIDPNKSFGMLFLAYTPGDPLTANRYGILEPLYHESHVCSPQDLDIAFMPLVQFDLMGNRIGMGAGFYDRCFAFTKTQAHDTLLLGLAHDFQKTKKIQAETWDVPLDGVVTDQTVYLINLDS